MANYWRLVNRVIMESDILLEVLDSRMVEESRNKEIEDKVRKAGKVLIHVINKCDLVEKSKLEKFKRTLMPCVFISAKDLLGTSFLRQEIMKNAPKNEFRVGVLGYPNTGKSSVINALKGKKSAPTAPISGYTKGIQLIRINKRMYIVDTPGVLPYMEKEETKHALISARTFGNLKDPEAAAMEIIEKLPACIEKHYSVEHDDDPEKTLENIALKLKKLKKKGLPDTYSAARLVLNDWQKGKIKRDNI